jgi:hypothetical protein
MISSQSRKVKDPVNEAWTENEYDLPEKLGPKSLEWYERPVGSTTRSSSSILLQLLRLTEGLA